MRVSIFAILFTICAPSIGQTIRIADNNPSAPSGANIFATFQDAIDAAVPGDVIQVIPSLTNYGAGVIDKQLSVFGVGFNPTTTFALTSVVSSITLLSINASGTKISGLVFSDFFALNLAGDTGSTYTISNITIENCVAGIIFHGTITNQIANLNISGCIIGSGVGNNGNLTVLTLATGDGATSGVVISNNILYNTTSLGAQARGSISAANNTLITNNLFVGFPSFDQAAFSTLRNCIVTNNIFYGTGPFSTGGLINELNVFTNNLTHNTADDALPPLGNGVGNTGSGNLAAVDPMIINVPYNNFWVFTNDPSLGGTSPALLAGTNGTDIGISGYTTPFSTSGTSVPTILQLNTNSLVNQGEDLQVTIQAQSND